MQGSYMCMPGSDPRTLALLRPPQPEDGELHISLTKLEQGDPWPSAIKGHEMDVVTQQAEQQRLMLERFQREVRARAHVQLACVWGLRPGWARMGQDRWRCPLRALAVWAGIHLGSDRP